MVRENQDEQDTQEKRGRQSGRPKAPQNCEDCRLDEVMDIAFKLSAIGDLLASPLGRSYPTPEDPRVAERETKGRYTELRCLLSSSPSTR